MSNRKDLHINKSIRLWGRSIASLFFRRECICCRRELLAFETDICTSCLADLPLSFTWQDPSSGADKTFWGRVNTGKVTSLFLYKGPYKKLIYSIKYNGNHRLAVRLGKMLGERIAEETDIIVPVPLHPRKKRLRGYNQSELIAKGIAETLRVGNINPEIENKLLERRNFTRTQTQKDRADRWENVKNAFCINPKRAKALQMSQSERPIHILLVDDVLTTGATLDACATNLLEALDCTISIATLAYVP